MAGAGPAAPGPPGSSLSSRPGLASSARSTSVKHRPTSDGLARVSAAAGAAPSPGSGWASSASSNARANSRPMGVAGADAAASIRYRWRRARLAWSTWV
ncbi:MAG TPA: hypothetical protein VGS06_41075 [Streptosporangiaceae bacterium]|nr:hypothetical protein [Streptosporangiaceae bacterium]